MIRDLLFNTQTGDRCLAALERLAGIAVVDVGELAERTARPTFFGRCPTCGAVGLMVYVGDQENEAGQPPIALANCSRCGSTVCAQPLGERGGVPWLTS